MMIDAATLIVFYCKTCQKIVNGVSKGKQKRYSFECEICKGDCLYGTARSLIHVFRIKEHSDNGQILLTLQKEKLKQEGIA